MHVIAIYVTVRRLPLPFLLHTVPAFFFFSFIRLFPLLFIFPYFIFPPFPLYFLFFSLKVGMGFVAATLHCLLFLVLKVF